MTFVSQSREAGGTLTDRPRTAQPLTSIRADELLNLTFPEFEYRVDGLIPNGLTILAGAPKIGKSWMALGLALAVVLGTPALGRLATRQSGVLYAALEDNHRRLQARLKKLLGTGHPDQLHFMTQLPRLDEGLVGSLRSWLGEHPDVQLVIIDTLARIRPSGARSHDYLEDTQVLQGLQDLANEMNIAILVVTHTRKTEAQDSFDEVLGSRGLTGVADTILVARRGRNQADANIAVTGRDVEEREVAVKFDHKTAAWSYLGPTSQFDVTVERRRLLDAIGKAAPGGIGPKALATELGDTENNVKQMLRRAVEDGQVVKDGRGVYALHGPPEGRHG
jgi:hypothetical protein